jgi:Fur family transcriptional regulator, ferric uptake regulator
VVVPQLDDILTGLRAEGGRGTVQRRVVISALLARSRHVTADELTADVQAEHPDIAKSTVYRILEALERQGVVRHAHMGHGPAVYHVNDDDHLHLVCEACGRVTEVPRTAYARFAEKLAQDYGFTAAPHHFAVHGRCAKCEGKPALPHSGNQSGVTRRGGRAGARAPD